MAYGDETVQEGVVHATLNKGPSDDPMDEPYICNLQHKQLPNFMMAMNDADLHVKPQISQLKSIIAEKYVTDGETREHFLPRTHMNSPNEHSNIVSDSNVVEETPAKYCLVPKRRLHMKCSNSQITMVKSNNAFLGAPSPYGLVYTPSPEQLVDISTDQDMASLPCSTYSNIDYERGLSNESVLGGSISDSESENLCQRINMGASEVTLLWEEFKEKFDFDEVRMFKDHIEHAYLVCELVKGGGDCTVVDECSGPQTRDYVDQQLQSVHNCLQGCLDLDESQSQIVYTCFRHSMECNLSICIIPLCTEFKIGMADMERKERHNLEHCNSGYHNTPMSVLYSDTSFFDCASDNVGGRRRMVLKEETDFKFIYEQFLNEGSFGCVYDTWLRGFTSALDARIAVKKNGEFFSKHGFIDLRADFITEIGSSPHLLLPYVILSSPKLNYVIMQKAEISLSVYLARLLCNHDKECLQENHWDCQQSALDVSTASLYLYQMASGLKHLHDHGYIHGDIKPDNVLLMPNNDVKICDFDGVKKEKENSKIIVTPGYTAPEVFEEGVVYMASDVFSLCCCIPEMLLAYPMKRNIKIKQDIQARTDALNPLIDKKDHNLFTIFSKGMHIDHLKRPSLQKIINCFRWNNEMHERCFTDPNVNSYITTETELENDKNKSLGKKILEKWLSNIFTKQLCNFLPPFSSKEIEMDNSNEEFVNLNVEQILSE